ncbi:DUF6801 domain-containing protein [Kitasatospora sp. MAP5-34]|uniref:DUF6801 domain-containing protein n=1 Tax=Kitasatospora sp. MAP5-34 TaxID=3035102 RepID=UPI002473283D|nr:DUF6801 domain-containing protein [Kitasatospora sp. MAP5-34]MDH6577235.1 hypothetical protein [Kitasatospora sp. MAP5-34]
MRDAVVRHRSVRLAAVAVAGLLAGLLPGVESASGGQAGRVSLTYNCRFPGGEQDVSVGLEQSYPAVGAVEKSIQPGPLTLTVALARAGSAVLLPPGTVAVGGTAGLAVRITQGTSRADADWNGLAAPSTPLVGKGDLVLTFAGPVAPVSVTAGGAVTFAAGDLVLDLLAERAGPTPTPTPTPSPSPSASPASTLAPPPVSASAPPKATPPAVKTPAQPAPAAPVELAVSCALRAAGGAQLGTVPVPLVGPSPTPAKPSASTSASSRLPSAPPSATAAGTPSGTGSIRIAPAFHSGRHDCPPPPVGELDKSRLPPVPPGAFVIVPPSPPSPACAYAVGYANVAKLGQASVVNDPAKNPAMVVLNMSRRFVLDNPAQYIEQDALGTLTLPVADTTFLTYGFIPTTAKMELKPVGLMTIVVTGSTVWQQPIEFTIGGYQTMRLFDVRVNGTPLDVGPDCHTASNINLVLRGKEDSYLPGGGNGQPDYSIQGGGPLSQTDLYIPEFTGCGTHGENLDALFTAAVSGPANSLNLIQAPLCTPDGTTDPSNGCYPEIQIPELPHRR